MFKKYETIKGPGYEALFDQLERERLDISGQIEKARANWQGWKQQNEDLMRSNSEHQHHIDILKEEKRALQKRLVGKSVTLPEKLAGRHSAYRSHPNKMKLKETHSRLVREIILRFGAYIQHVLLDPKEAAQPTENQKEQYKIYGLLLSSCVLKQHILKESNPNIVDKVLEATSISDKEIIRPHVIKAVEMTQKMLLILPPLIVWKPLAYNEHLQDTNRLTWDETIRDGVCLKYYRPVLLYGSNLHVAVKGLVGNKECEMLEGESVDELTHSTKVISRQPVIQSQSQPNHPLVNHDVTSFTTKQRHDHFSSSLGNNATGMDRISGHRTRSFSSSNGQHSKSPCTADCYKDPHKPDVKITGYQ